MPSSSIDLRTQSISVPSSGYVWPSGSRAQASTVPCSLSVRPQMDMNMAKLEEARLVLQAMDCRTTWKDDDGDTWVRETEWRDIFPFYYFIFFMYRMTVGVHHLVVSLVLIFPSLKLNDEQSIKILMSKTWLCSQCSVWSFRSYMVRYAVHWLLLYNMICNIIPFVNCNIIPIIGMSSMDLSASETVKSTFLIIKWYWRMNQSFFWHMTFVIVLFWYQNQCHSVIGLWRVFCL